MNEGVGVSAVAKALYIKPRPASKSSSGFSAESRVEPDLVPSFAVLDSTPFDETMA
jgi:hypothetical protein